MARQVSLSKKLDILFDNTKLIVGNKDVIEHYSVRKNNFTRKRELIFSKVVFQILNLIKSSIADELERFEKTITKTEIVAKTVRKSSFSKARHKIKWQFFYDLVLSIVFIYYSTFKVKKWKKYRVLAVDGSVNNLPPSKELNKYFGTHHINSIGTKIPNARTSLLYDPLNNISIDAKMEPFKVSEQAMLFEHFNHIVKGDLLTADPNYGHFHIMKMLEQKKVDFCIRMNTSSRFVKDFINSGKDDKVLIWSPSVKTKQTCKKHKVNDIPIKIRLVKIDISDKVTEILATSLTNIEQVTLKDLKELYNIRWAVEEEYKKYMQRTIIEFFSSTKVNGVMQDFYANVFMVNLTNVFRNIAQEQVGKDDIAKDRKNKHQVNWTEGLRKIKPRFILFFVRSKQEVADLVMSIIKSMRTNIEKVVKNRKFKRDSRKKGSRQKAFMWYK